MRQIDPKPSAIHPPESSMPTFRGFDLPPRMHFAALRQALPEQRSETLARVPKFLASIGFGPSSRDAINIATKRSALDITGIEGGSFLEVKTGTINYEGSRPDGWVFHPQWTGDGPMPVASPGINYSHPALAFKKT